MRIVKKIIVSVLRIAAGVPIVSLLAVGLLFFGLGATLSGRSVGLGGAVLAAVLFCSVGYWNRNWFKRIRRRLLAVLLPASVLLYLVPMMLAPSGGDSDGRVRNCFLRGQGQFSRYSPANVVPEVDQLEVGLCLAPLADPYVDMAKANRIRSLVLPLYDQMDKEPDFRALGSVMGLAYRELLHLEFRTGHYYIFMPQATSGEKLPCLVFLHGMGGNAKACLWVLSGLSKRSKCAVIAPTFGIGNWDKAGSAELIVDVVRESLTTLPLDPDKVFLMGYSNGATGVTRAAVKEPRLFRGLIYLSPITEDHLFSTNEFSTVKRDRRLLFLHGGRDERIPRSLVEGTVTSLRAMGCEVRLKVYEEEDHFLLFSQQDAVLGDIIEFMAAEQSSEAEAKTHRLPSTK
jgi:predicted esterase